MPLLAPDVQYCFDGAVECCGITGDVASYFYHYHPNANQWFDALEREPRFVFGRFPREAAQAHATWRQTAPPIQRAALSVVGLLTLRHQLREISLGAVNDVTRREGHGRKARRRLSSPRVLRKAIKRSPHALRFLSIARDLMERAREDFKAVDFFGDSIISEIDRTGAIWRKAHDRELSIRRCGLKPDRATLRKARKHRRKVITRSHELLSSIMGREAARMFVSGDAIEIHGRNFNFLAKKHLHLAHKGHGGLAITITDKGGVVLSDLCFYFADLPPMDQVAALAMAVHSGDEEEIIDAGNLYRVQAVARHNKTLVRLKPKSFAEEREVPRVVYGELSDFAKSVKAIPDEEREASINLGKRLVAEMIDPRQCFLALVIDQQPDVNEFPRIAA